MQDKKSKEIVYLSLALVVGLASATKVAAQTYITSDLNVGFPLEAAVANGGIRVLIPTATDSANVLNTNGTWNSGTPVQGAFVAPAGGTGLTVTCPSGAGLQPSQFTFGTPVINDGQVFYNPATGKEITQAEAATLGGKYLRFFGFTCPYTGTGAIGGQFTAGGTYNIEINGLINPLAVPGQTLINEAIVVPGKVQLLQSGYTGTGVATNYLVSDNNVLISAFAQDVLITAKVESQLMFRIDPVAEGSTVCANKTTTVGSSSLLIDYGSPTVGSLTDAAQQIFIDSSANNGYVVTMTQDQPMGRNGVDCPSDGLINTTTINRDCIPNFGWETDLQPNAAAAWTNAAQTGLGYTVLATNFDGNVGSKNTPVANAIFNNGSDYTRLTTTGQTDPVTVASSNGIAAGDIYDVCYRLSIDAQNNAGTYDNAVTYTITASF